MNLFQALQWATVEDGWARAVQQKKILKKELHTHTQLLLTQKSIRKTKTTLMIPSY